MDGIYSQYSVEFDVCDSEFINLNKTWHTNRPQFSACFRNTALSWIPACVFILTLTNEISRIRQARTKNKGPLQIGTINVLKCFTTLALILIASLECFSVIENVITNLFPPGHNATSHQHHQFEASNKTVVGSNDPGGKTGITVVAVSSILAPILSALCYTVLLLIYVFHRKFGVHTSGPVWLFLFVKLACTSIDYYSVISTSAQMFSSNIEMLAKYAHLPLLATLFVFDSYGDTPNIDHDATAETSGDARPYCPELQASYFSSITFWWFNSFLIFGYRCKLRLIDLWRTLPRDKAADLVPIFREAWIKKAASPSARTGKKLAEATYHLASGETYKHNSVLRVMLKLFWSPLLFAAGLKFMQDSLQYLTPLILKRLIRFMSSSSSPQWHGILFALLLLIVPTLQSIFLASYFYRMQLIGQHVKTMIVSSVYRKALLLSGSSRIQSTSGEIVNLMSVDSQRFQDLLMYLNLFWSAPFQIALAIYLLYCELGWSVFAGVICMVLVLPCNAYLANRVKFAQIKVMKTKDKRIRQINEVLSGIKVIKLYAWENSFMANLFKFRNKELSFLRRILTLDALLTFLWQCSPFVVACVTFAVYINSDPANVLNAEKAFVSISLFNLLKFPLSMLPSLVTSMVLTMVSSRRLNRFLNSDELIKYVERNEALEAISIEGGTLAWTSGEPLPATTTTTGNSSNSNNTNGVHSVSAASAQNAQIKPVLRDIDLHVQPKSFVAIVGQVASGKSSLLASILNELHRISGRFNVCKSMRMAYVPQQAWIQNMTVRENILFGSQYDEHRYKQVLDACSLRADLDTLPGGDQAEIGEKGINLSGGQKQRVSLARACYSNSDIYLLDDPLSALDSHVAKHVFEHVLSSTTGLLRDKTRVLATNSLFVLQHVDHIVVLDAGRVVESGSYRQLMDTGSGGGGGGGGYLAEFMRQYSVADKEEEQQDEKVDSSSKDGRQRLNCNQDEQLEASSLVGKQESGAAAAAAAAPASAGSLAKQTAAAAANDLGKLIDVEKVELGSVNHRVYLSYFKSVSFFWLVIVAISLIGSSAFNVATNLWLSLWASDADNAQRASDTDLKTVRLLVYAIFGGLQCLAVLAGSLALSVGATQAARQLHKSLLERVMHSPMGFFDTTPIGRVVNRFAKDIDVVDSTLPGTFRSWFNCLLQVLSTLFVICYSFPTFLILLLPLGIVYYLIQKVFIVTTRQLKRMESTTRSPIYSNFNETLSGASTIRAYDCTDRFVRYCDDLIDRNQSCSYPNIIANRWLSIRLELFGNIITASAALFSVYYRGTIDASVAGLTISYSLSITQTLSWLVRMTSDLETNIVSVERILEYMDNRQEDRWIKEESRPALDWPKEGAIAISGYSTRYRDDTDLVLRDISIDIKPREKIGIVGRTGSGKSSLSLALFRILEPTQGCIAIDGLNLIDYGLHDIRSKLTIIPQDPVLFSGTLRFNLDPLKFYPDADIWRSLELAHLKPYISSLETGLDYQVSEYGENFSVGQRQLICLARAILRKSKILILDEATASVDLETDSIVQRAIRDIFSDCTIITIAHRLHTILDSDRILVLDSGYVKELDSPQNLIADQNSSFAALVRDAGVDTSSVLSQRRAMQQQEQ